jgi:hypothetical protein
MSSFGLPRSLFNCSKICKYIHRKRRKSFSGCAIVFLVWNQPHVFPKQGVLLPGNLKQNQKESSNPKKKEKEKEKTTV